MQWREWLRSEAGCVWTAEAIARVVGCHEASVYRWNTDRPSGEMMLRLAWLTGFAVLPNDWYPDLQTVMLPLPPREPPILRMRSAPDPVIKRKRSVDRIAA